MFVNSARVMKALVHRHVLRWAVSILDQLYIITRCHDCYPICDCTVQFDYSDYAAMSQSRLYVWLICYTRIVWPWYKGSITATLYVIVLSSRTIVTMLLCSKADCMCGCDAQLGYCSCIFIYLMEVIICQW